LHRHVRFLLFFSYYTKYPERWQAPVAENSAMLSFKYMGFDEEKNGGALPLPHAQLAQVRFMRTLLVSHDLTADETSAAGGHRRFVPTRGMMPLDSTPGEITWLVIPNKFRLLRWGY
jgi:hypothetical protein